MTKPKLFLALLALMMLSALLMSMISGVHATAAVWTDKADYEFWETVTIFGSGFNPNANIDLTITRPDGVVDTGSTMSNASGNFVYYYVLNGIVGTYAVAATDGVNSANTTFTETRYRLQGYTKLPHARWTGGILKGWLECEDVPYRLKMIEVENKTYVLSNYHDNKLSGVTGIDYCTDFYVGYEDGTVAPSTEVIFSVSGPFYQKPHVIKEIYYTWNVMYTLEAEGKTYYLYWKAHLGVSSSSWPGAKLHSKTNITGAQDVPIAVPPAVFGEISGYKFNDLDGDGIWDLSEPALTDGWAINLYMWDETTSQWVFQTSTTTDINGYYEFTNLFYDDYKVTEDVKDGWINTLSPGYPITLTDTYPTSEDNNFGNYEWQDLDVSKTANAEWNRAFTWDIEKTADQTTLNLFDGEEGTITYTITVTKSVASDYYRVYGTITIVNPNPVAIVITATVLDEVLNPSDVVIGSQDFGTQIIASGTNTFDYSIELSPDDIGPGYYKNKVTVTVTDPVSVTYEAYSPTFEFTEPTEKVHDSAIVSDSEDLGGLTLVSTTYDGPWTTSTSNSWAFTKTVKSDAAGTYTLTNTAEVRDAVTDEWLDSDDKSVVVMVHALSVTKTANVEWVQTFAWTITKTADPTALNLLVGEEGTISYTITVTRSVVSDYYRVYGTITIVNPNPDSDAAVTITDDLLGMSGETCTVTPSSVTVPKADSATVNYECTGFWPTVGTEYTNEATVTLTLTGKTYIGSDKFTFTDPTELEDDQATVDDDQTASLELTVTCTGNCTWPQAISGSTTYSYVKTVSSDTAGIYQIDDTATFVTDDTGTTDSASASVDVFVSERPVPVGGIWTPVNKYELLAPWIGLTSLVISGVAASVVFLKSKRKKK